MLLWKVIIVWEYKYTPVSHKKSITKNIDIYKLQLKKI